MNRYHLALAVSLAVAAFARAADSCTPWTLQPDGGYFRTCVTDAGKQYCQSIPKGSKTVNTVPCT